MKRYSIYCFFIRIFNGKSSRFVIKQEKPCQTLVINVFNFNFNLNFNFKFKFDLPKANPLYYY